MYIGSLLCGSAYEKFLIAMLVMFTWMLIWMHYALLIFVQLLMDVLSNLMNSKKVARTAH